MLALPHGEIHIWYVLINQISDSSLLTEYERLLSDKEISQMSRFVFPQDRKQFLITRTLLRTTLSRYVPILPSDWSFHISSKGKPSVSSHTKAKGLAFNLAHTNGLILMGVTTNSEIGVDVEANLQKADLFEIARNNFSKEEVAALGELSGSQQRELFYMYWTLKESYVKARGEGLSLPLNFFRFELQDGAKIIFHTSEQLDDHASHWKFWQFKPSDDHIASVCVAQKEEFDPILKVQQVIPLQTKPQVRQFALVAS